MHAELQAQVAFYLTGKSGGEDLIPIEGLNLRPALFAAYRNLTRLRYDYPVILVRKAGDGAPFESLSAAIDQALDEIGASGSDGERLRAHAWKLEHYLRTVAAAGTAGTLTQLLERAAQRLAPAADSPLAESARRLRAALKIEGEIIDCGVAAPARMLTHAWEAAQRRKADSFRALLERLILKLGDVLRADHARSEAGRTPESLRASVGNLHADDFDFAAMSRMLARVSPKSGLSDRRRRRIESTLAVLERQRFFPANGGQRLAFRFERCSDALAAWRERLPEMIALAKAVAIAELELKGEYNEQRHGAVFELFGQGGLDHQHAARFPDYLVCANARDLRAEEHDRLMEILASGLPMKVLVQTDDLIEPAAGAADHLGVGARSRQLVNAAIGLNDVYVLQASASHLVRYRDRVLKALTVPGPALISVFSGASGQCGDLPAYLVAAAAMESRAFPGFVYDPSAGSDWASRFTLDANPQPDCDWAEHRLSYEDSAHQRVEQDVEFTLVDFLACDRRHAMHFAKVPREKWNGNLATVADCLTPEGKGLPQKLPTLLMADRDDRLHKVIVDDRLIREARRCRDLWRSLQELGGIHNSHAERLVARERKEWEKARAAEAPAATAQAPAAATAPAAAPVAAPAAAPAAEPEKERSSDEPYIETARCSTCNECINLNDKMFAYDENKQARIVNPDAGTYRQLVEAAESCQVAVIHPGKPRNPDEPGLEELLKRAEPFL